MYSQLLIQNRLGLHARASAKLTAVANQYVSEIWLTKDQKRVNAKSIMGVLLLSAGYGATIDMEVDGPDQSEAVMAIVQLVNHLFGESE